MRRAGFLLGLLGGVGCVVPSIAWAAEPATVTFGGEGRASAGGNGNGASASAAATPSSDSEREWDDRDRALNEATTLTGGVGLLNTQHAMGSAPGQFRLAFTTEYFSASFLCTSEFPCRDPRTTNGLVISDGTDHIGGRLTLSMQLLKWLEPYLGTSAFANSTSSNRPQLLQVLGDSVLGAKAHGALSNVFHVGGAFELWLLNGTGAVGLDGAGTSAKFRGLATADLRGLEKPLPARFSLNLTYSLDNSGQVIQDTEAARGTSITRIERFGLNINRVDHFDIHVGGELFLVDGGKVRPFLEYNIAAPVNRQGYLCRPNNPSQDRCLANEGVAPSTLSFGARYFPWKNGFSLLTALDVGITGVGTFIEEVRPTPPWVLYLGGGWAFDTQERPKHERVRFVDRPLPGMGRRIRGFVHEEGKSEGIAGAILTWDNHPEITGMVTANDGRFTTPELPDGPYVFNVQAEGYRSGQCTTVLTSPKSAPVRGGPPAAPAADAPLDCPLVALPKVGSVVGKVKDLDTGAPVANAAIKLEAATKKELTGTSDAQGAFRFEQIAPGEAHVSVEADGYLTLVQNADVKPRQDNPVELALKKRPKNPLVAVGKTEIVIKQQIQFALNSANILPESTGLLTEIADVLLRSPRIHKVEVAGHTDATGTPEVNRQLSEDRANAVLSWLTAHGVSADRLVARGYGQTKPLVPNVTAANRARNRRVQFIILEQDAPGAAPKGPAKGDPKLDAPGLPSRL